MSVRDWLISNNQAARNWLTRTCIVVVILSCGYMVYAALRTDVASRSIAMMCPACGYTDEHSLSLGDTIPMTCPRCGKQTLYPAFRCKTCGAINIWNEYLGKQPPTFCVECNQKHVHGH